MRLLFLLLLPFILQAQLPKDKRTPFNAVKYENARPLILFEDEWLAIERIENIPIENYLSLAATMDPTDWQNGFHRYIHYIWDHLQIERDSTIKVELSNGEGIIVVDLSLIEKNRDLASDFHRSQLQSKRIRRTHLLETPDSLQYLSSRLDTNSSVWISATEAKEDLDYLEWELTQHYSYLNYRDYNYKGAFDVIRHALAEGISRRDFARQLSMLLAGFGDGHTRISRREFIMERKTLPSKISLQEGLYYYNDQEIIGINGVKIQHLAALASRYAPKTTQGFQGYVTESLLNNTEFILAEIGAIQGDSVKITFRDSEKTEVLGNFSHRKVYKLLEDSIYGENVGYLGMRGRMENDEEFLAILDSTMQEMLDMDALIIDIRNNGGGSRAPLVKLLPYLIKRPKIVNVARYRINEIEDYKPALGYMENRYMFPRDIDSIFWKYADYKINAESFQHLVDSFESQFQPSILVSDSLFSDYHFMMVEPHDSVYFQGPVIVLINESCFSASDIFAAGIRQGDRVQLMGKTTGGGSGFSTTKILPHSQLKIRHSRMFSYQPNGKMYDGNGVVPDILYKNEGSIIVAATKNLMKLVQE